MTVLVSMRNIPHRAGPLNTWSPTDVLVGGREYGGAALLGGLGEVTASLHLQLALCFLHAAGDVLSQLPAPAAMLLLAAFLP